MNLVEVKGDLFAEPYYKGEDVYAHCISSATDGHTIVNLVTKKNYWDKPTYDSMETSLRSLRQYLMQRPHIKRVLMPRIGCGLDRLDWSRVRVMIENILENVDVEVKVFYL